VIRIMTSNLGSQQMKSGAKLGFDRLSQATKPSDEERRNRMRADVMIEVERYFRPEFLNRLDELVVFNPLTNEDLSRIVHLQLDEVRRRLTEKGVKLELDPKAVEFLIVKGYSEDYGARPLRRAIERFVEDPLAEHILRVGSGSAAAIRVTVSEDGASLSFEQLKPTEPVPASS